LGFRLYSYRLLSRKNHIYASCHPITTIRPDR
jgi:hypothetical protein